VSSGGGGPPLSGFRCYAKQRRAVLRLPRHTVLIRGAGRCFLWGPGSRWLGLGLRALPSGVGRSAGESRDGRTKGSLAPRLPLAWAQPSAVDLRSLVRSGRYESPIVRLTGAQGGGGSSLAPAQRTPRKAHRPDLQSECGCAVSARLPDAAVWGQTKGGNVLELAET
jgi:hypothetical protein